MNLQRLQQLRVEHVGELNKIRVQNKTKLYSDKTHGIASKERTVKFEKNGTKSTLNKDKLSSFGTQEHFRFHLMAI